MPRNGSRCNPTVDRRRSDQALCELHVSCGEGLQGVRNRSSHHLGTGSVTCSTCWTWMEVAENMLKVVEHMLNRELAAVTKPAGRGFDSLRSELALAGWLSRWGPFPSPAR